MTTHLIVGLGNPGQKYEHTRHNLGFRVIEAVLTRNDVGVLNSSREADTLVSWFTIEGQGKNKYLALRPQTFMNESGRPVARFMRFYDIPLERLWVIHDDVDLPFGELREAFDRGSAGHNGVESIIEHLGSKAFYRLRIGIGSNRESNTSSEDYVLQNFMDEEEQLLMAQNGIIIKAAQQLLAELRADA